jgi:hypothetical protein
MWAPSLSYNGRHPSIHPPFSNGNIPQSHGHQMYHDANIQQSNSFSSAFVVCVVAKVESRKKYWRHNVRVLRIHCYLPRGSCTSTWQPNTLLRCWVQKACRHYFVAASQLACALSIIYTSMEVIIQCCSKIFRMNEYNFHFNTDRSWEQKEHF